MGALPAWPIRDLRSDHAGETGAVAIYRGILAISRSNEIHSFGEAHLQTEQQNLQLIETILPRNARSAFLPLWRVARSLPDKPLSSIRKALRPIYCSPQISCALPRTIWLSFPTANLPLGRTTGTARWSTKTTPISSTCTTLCERQEWKTRCSGRRPLLHTTVHDYRTFDDRCGSLAAVSTADIGRPLSGAKRTFDPGALNDRFRPKAVIRRT